MNYLIKFKKDNLKFIHILIIILGTIFSAISIFHPFLWFDESYSVGLANHSFSEIWSIDGHDVHPVFYYFCLHILNIIFGHNIIIYRIFSLTCTVFLGLLGYTHIRKDFGNKTGFLFSFLVFFFPPMLVYTGEIRMYTLSMLLVTLTSIYAYRIYKNNNTNFNLKNWIIFGFSSILGAYTHYYSLMASGLINLILMVYFIIELIKFKKFTKNILTFIIIGIFQILLYIPWLLTLLSQVNQVSNGFWIGIKFPDTIIEFFIFQFTGNLEELIYVPVFIGLVWGLFITFYLIYINKLKSKNINRNELMENNIKASKFSIRLFLGIALAACIVSLVIWRPIIYARYMLCVFGLFIFFISFSMSKNGNKKINIAICLISIFLSIYININFIKANYSKENYKPINYIKEDIKENDIIIVSNDLNGFVMSTQFQDNISYFYDRDVWYMEEAYKAFSKDFRTIYDLDSLNDYSGKIWLINAKDFSLYDEFNEKFDVKLIKREFFKTDYKNYEFTITLIEK